MYLKGHLVLNGRRPPRIHDLDALLSLVAEIEPELYDPYIELCERATRYYLDERYPPGPPVDYPRQQIAADLDAAGDLVRILRERASPSASV